MLYNFSNFTLFFCRLIVVREQSNCWQPFRHFTTFKTGRNSIRIKATYCIPKEKPRFPEFLQKMVVVDHDFKRFRYKLSNEADKITKFHGQTNQFIMIIPWTKLCARCPVFWQMMVIRKNMKMWIKTRLEWFCKTRISMPVTKFILYNEMVFLVKS